MGTKHLHLHDFMRKRTSFTFVMASLYHLSLFVWNSNCLAAVWRAGRVAAWKLFNCVGGCFEKYWQIKFNFIGIAFISVAVIVVVVAAAAAVKG